MTITEAAAPPTHAPRPVAPGPASTPFTRQPALDGLRGVAVLGILVYHAGFRWMSGGFLAVSTFFTLSGFLITTVLLQEHRSTGRLDKRRFYARRLRRLLPASLLAMAFLTLASVRFGSTGQIARLPGDLVGGLAYVANWRFVAQGDSYGALFSSASPMQHFWSLAIEEQFYLLFPLLLGGVLLLGRGSHRVVGWVLGGLLALSLTVSAVLVATGASSDRLYFGSDVRAAELLIGALLALAWRRLDASRRFGRAAVALAGLLALVVTVALWTGADHSSHGWYLGGLALYAVGTAIIIVAALQPWGPLHRFLTWRPLVGLGLISYGVYLLHWPIFVFVDERTGLAPWPLFALRLALTLGLAGLSYVLLEQPVRQGRLRGRRSWLFVPAVAVPMLLVAVVAGNARVLSPIESDAAEAAALPRAPAVDPAVPHVPRFGVYGDSTAVMLSLGLADWAREHPDVLISDGGFAGLGCGTVEATRDYGGVLTPYKEPCRNWLQSWKTAASTVHNDVAVVSLGPFEVTDTMLPGEATMRSIGDPVLDAQIIANFTSGIEALRASGAKVILLLAPDVETGRVDGRSPTETFPDANPSRMARWNQIQRDVAASHPGVTTLDLASYIAAQGDADRQLRPDGVHYTWETSDQVADWLAPEIAAVLRSMR